MRIVQIGHFPYKKSNPSWNNGEHYEHRHVLYRVESWNSHNSFLNTSCKIKHYALRRVAVYWWWTTLRLCSQGNWERCPTNRMIFLGLIEFQGEILRDSVGHSELWFPASNDRIKLCRRRLVFGRDVKLKVSYLEHGDCHLNEWPNFTSGYLFVAHDAFFTFISDMIRQLNFDFGEISNALDLQELIEPFNHWFLLFDRSHIAFSPWSESTKGQPKRSGFL
jgi:hypothetical protein